MMPTHSAKVLGRGKALVAEQKVCLETDPARARDLASQYLARYMVMDNYRNAWLRMGFTIADLSSGGSNGFVDQMVLWGEPAKLKQGLQAHFAAGATQVAIHPVHAAGDVKGRDAVLEALREV
jgi:hypothetical protein